MANFPGLQMTAAGRDLQAKAQTGVQLNFSRVAIGDGAMPADYEPLTSLVSEKKSLDLAGFELLGDGTSKLKVLLTNEGVIDGFFIREIGVFAIDPDTSTEILYSYSNADQYIDYLPAFGGATIVEMTFDLYTVVGNATTVTATINDYLVHATKADVDELRPYVLPTGGTVGMQLRRASNTSGDNEWFDPTEGIQIRINSVTEERTAVEGQTAFALTKTLTNGLAVYVNGLRIPNGDWSSAGGTQVVFDSPLNDGDKVQFVNNEEVGTASLSRVSLNGPDLVYQGTSNDYTITDYDAFSTYAVTSNIGTATHSNGVITLDIPTDAASDDGVLMTVQRNLGSMSFSIALGLNAVAQPQITSPEHNATNIGETPTLTASAFQTYPANMDTQASATWRIATDAAMTNVIWQSVDDAVNLTAITVPKNVLQQQKTYYADVEQAGVIIGASAKSHVISFTTRDLFIPSVPGKPFAGGYYAGIIDVGSTRYALVVAPKSGGESGLIEYKTSNTDSYGTQSVWDGKSNTSAMLGSDHPAAAFCAGLTVNGYADWYMPARDELEILYRNFKPTLYGNSTGGRYGGGDQGQNYSSDPTGGAYQSGHPNRTSVANFKYGGADSFYDEEYWSSTQSPFYGSAMQQSFKNGRQNDLNKHNNPRKARAVRRVLID